MFQFLMGKCPVFESQKKPNGAHYLVIDTSVFYLVPERRRSLIVAVKCVGKRAKAYGVKKPDSYKIRQFWKPAEEAYGKVKRKVCMQWHLTTRETMPGTRTIPHSRHAERLRDLNVRARVRYQFLSLQTAPFIFFFHQAATGERLYQVNNRNLTGGSTFTYVVERAGQAEEGTHPLVIGASSEKGLMIERAPKEDDYRNTGIGFAVERIWF